MNHFLLTWQLKSRIKWASQGDSNTKFFHAVASGRRAQNSVWSLEDHEGLLIEDEDTLKVMGKDFFANIFIDEGSTSLEHQLKVFSLFPRLIPSE